MGEPVWRQCLAWLDSWNMLPPGVQVTSPEELVALLRDGVVLCQLVHCLDPTSVDMTQVVYTHHTLPEMEAVSDFVCRNNIFLFLHAAIKNFNLDTDHYFDPPDLYEVRDLGMVLKTLSFLSHTAKFTASGRQGFPKKQHKLEKKIAAEEPLYGALASMAMGEATTPTRQGKTKRAPREGLYSPSGSPAWRSIPIERSTSVYSPSPQSEEIYNSICSPSRARPLIPALTKKSKREFPVREFMESEEKYLANLCMVRDSFQLQLQHMTSETSKVVFFRLQELIVLHGGLNRSMKAGDKGVGRCMLDHFPGFHLYRQWIVNLGTALALLQQVEETNPKVKKELIKCQLAASTPFPLSAHLVLPFQRLLKYHLLLAEVLKHTPTDHPEHEELAQAHALMKDFNLEVNEAKRVQEEEEKQLVQDQKDMAILANLQRTIKSMRLENNVRLQDFGRLRRAGEILVEGENTDYAFLLDSLLLVCNKPRLMQQRYRFKFSIKLADYQVAESSPEGSIRLVPRGPHLPPVLLVPRSPAELDLWLRALLLCMDQIYPSQNQESGHAPLLSCLTSLTCSHCSRPFVGLLGQGYRCRHCPALLHKACLALQLCQEEGVTMRRSGSMALPSFIDRNSLSRASMGSTMSLAPRTTISTISRDVDRANQEWRQEVVPVEEQDWWAGSMDLATATARIKDLPTGTFLVRGNLKDSSIALDLKAKTSVKHLKIYVVPGEDGLSYCFSEARSFPSLPELVAFYRSKDLLENFSYRELEGVTLKTPYKNA